MNENRAVYRVYPAPMFGEANPWVQLTEAEPLCRARLLGDEGESMVTVKGDGSIAYDQNLVEVDYTAYE